MSLLDCFVCWPFLPAVLGPNPPERFDVGGENGWLRKGRVGRKGGGCVCVCVARYGFDPSLSELTGLVVRGVKLRIFMF